MNKAGQLVFVGIMVAVLGFMMVVAFIEPIKEQVGLAEVALDCDNASLSAGDAGACIVTDSYLFGFVGVCCAVLLGWIGLRRLGGVESQ